MGIQGHIIIVYVSDMKNQRNRDRVFRSSLDARLKHATAKRRNGKRWKTQRGTH